MKQGNIITKSTVASFVVDLVIRDSFFVWSIESSIDGRTVPVLITFYQVFGSPEKIYAEL